MSEIRHYVFLAVGEAVCAHIFSADVFYDPYYLGKNLNQESGVSRKIWEIVSALLIVGNYRPISLLSNINKILEKLMFTRLYSFLESNKCIYDLQFGFRKKHSTNHALLNMTQQIKEAMDKGNIAIGVFVDFQKAFDTVNHKILLHKLEHYGVRGIANSWFSSYLANRQQYVSIGGINSETKPIMHGVPQGSAGPSTISYLYQ